MTTIYLTTIYMATIHLTTIFHDDYLFGDHLIWRLFDMTTIYMTPILYDDHLHDDYLYDNHFLWRLVIWRPWLARYSSRVYPKNNEKYHEEKKHEVWRYTYNKTDDKISKILLLLLAYFGFSKFRILANLDGLAMVHRFFIVSPWVLRLCYCTRY